jgi:hypothetical protein
VNLTTYRKVVAPYRKAARRRWRRRYLAVAHAYRQATGKTEYTLDELVDWATAQGLGVEKDALLKLMKDALCGYPAPLCRHAHVHPEALFLYHPGRLVRAVREALCHAGGAPDEAVLDMLPAAWRRLAEAPADAPFPWPEPLVRLVLAAVRRGEL